MVFNHYSGQTLLEFFSGKDIQTHAIEEGAVPVHQKIKDQRLSHEQPVAVEDTI